MTKSSIHGGGEVILYKAPDGAVGLDVRLEREAVWLSLVQMAKLFRRDKSVISRHLRNVFVSKELERKATVAKNATVQNEAGRDVVREIGYFNLDAIISVGYRVNSKRGTQFRIWATRTLKDHLLRGYTLHEKRLREQGLGEIEQAVGLLARTLTANALVADEGRAVLEVVQQYTRAWQLLLEYDEGRLAETPGRPVKQITGLSLDDGRTIIVDFRESLAGRGEATDLFGAERADQLHGILGAIEQTFVGQPLYPTVQARAAHQFSTSSSRITLSLTATSALVRCYSWNICAVTACSPCQMAGRVLPTTRWWH